MDILITGGGGLLGHKVAIIASQKHNVYITEHKASVNIKDCKKVKVDITKDIKIDISPEVIIHTAGLTNVDLCESDFDLAYRVHIEGTRNLITAFPEAKFIYISTDYVFDGEKGEYKETDRPNPINNYGKTKYLAEKLIPKNGCVIRTVFYGWNLLPAKYSYSERILNALKEGRILNIFKDQIFSPILTDDLAEIILKIIQKDLKGLYHIGASDKISKYDFALKVAEVFNYNSNLIRPISISEVKLKARRPKDVSLNCEKIKKDLGISLSNIEEGLRRAKERS